jgi:hypothetical protein
MRQRVCSVRLEAMGDRNSFSSSLACFISSFICSATPPTFLLVVRSVVPQGRETSSSSEVAVADKDGGAGSTGGLGLLSHTGGGGIRYEMKDDLTSRIAESVCGGVLI